jgi:hypothetical protein
MAQQSTNQNSSQLIRNGVCIGKVDGNTDFCLISDGNFTVQAFDSQGTTKVGDKVQVYKSGPTYMIGVGLS